MRLKMGFLLVVMGLIVGQVEGASLVTIELVNDSHLVRIDPLTGDIVRFGTSLGRQTNLREWTFDPVSEVFYFGGEDSIIGDNAPRIYTVDAQTGTILNNPILSNGWNYFGLGLLELPQFDGHSVSHTLSPQEVSDEKTCLYGRISPPSGPVAPR